MPLTAKQQRFVQEYLLDLNAAAAARRAGYSERVADRQGYENLRKPEIAQALQAAQQARAGRTQVKADRVLTELARLAFSDPRTLFQPDGSLKPVAEWGDDTAAAVASLESFEEFAGSGPEKKHTGHTRKLKLWDKVSALDKLCKHLGLYREPGDAPDHPLHVLHLTYEQLLRLPPHERARIQREALGLPLADMDCPAGGGGTDPLPGEPGPLADDLGGHL